MPQSELGLKGLLEVSGGRITLPLQGPFRVAHRVQCHLSGTHPGLHMPHATLHCGPLPSGFYSVLSCCLAFSPFILFFILASEISGVYRYQASLRVRRGMRLSTVQTMHLMNIKCRNLVVCSHLCHQIVAKIQVIRFFSTCTV